MLAFDLTRELVDVFLEAPSTDYFQLLCHPSPAKIWLAILQLLRSFNVNY